LEFDEAAGRTTRYGLHDLADDSLLCSFVEEKNELARNQRGGKPDNRTVRRNQNRPGSFGKGLAFVGAFDDASAMNGYKYFEFNQRWASRRFGTSLGKWW
jgi:hypothetical protein